MGTNCAPLLHHLIPLLDISITYKIVIMITKSSYNSSILKLKIKGDDFEPVYCPTFDDLSLVRHCTVHTLLGLFVVLDQLVNQLF